MNLLPVTSPGKVQSGELHEGDWETHGSVKLWKYTIDGKEEQFKERVEVDEATKTVALVGIEGHAMELYKTYKATFKVESGLAKVTVEYEKHNEQVPAANNYAQFLAGLVKDIDAHVLKGY